MPLTAVAAVNVNIAEALNEAEVISASWARETCSFLTTAQKYEVGKRAAEHSVTTTIRYYGKYIYQSRFGTEGKHPACIDLRMLTENAASSFTRKFCSVNGSTPNVFILVVSPHHTRHCKRVHHFYPGT